MKPLVFVRKNGYGKPSDYHGRRDKCPFCDYQETENIIETCDDIIWTRNKYPVLADTYQTLIIETPWHNENIATYSKEHNRKMLKFAFECWQKIKNDPLFESVIFYKNHGSMSGGTLMHAHAQIVGLKNVDAYEKLRPEHFCGIVVEKMGSIEVNFSTAPFCGTKETNIVLPKEKLLQEFDIFADLLQVIVQMEMEKVQSFNLFFYDFQEKIIVKFTPRYPTPPYYVGFGIPQVLDKESMKSEALNLQRKIRKLMLE